MEGEGSGTAALAAGEAGQAFLEELLEAMRLTARVDVDQREDGTWLLEIVGLDAGQLVGRYGSTLNALQYLTGLVIQKRTGEHTRVLLDADGYRERREAALIEQARGIAAEVKRSGQEAELDPLSAFERRIIHNALLDDPDVRTYSEGEDPDRRIIIAPRSASA
jgi:spoIIIJ-associated protein